MEKNLILTSSICDINVQLSSTDVKQIGCQDPLFYYEVSVEFDDTLCSVAGTLLRFNYAEGGSAYILSEFLNSVSSPFVMNTYGCMEGLKEHSDQTFLALPFFDKTFASFIEKGSDMTVENGRFTDEFIDIIGDVVKGLLKLHKLGYCCPAFKGHHVAVVTQNGQPRAKIWNFCVAGSEMAKLGDWSRLADKIEVASINHKVMPSLEIADLCNKMRNGQLRGLKILKHCALLSVSKKSNEILALSNYALMYSDKSRQHPYVNDPIKSKVHDDLFIFLDSSYDWYQVMPQWMKTAMSARRKTLPTSSIMDYFLYERRSFIEHANLYVPPPPPQELQGLDSKNNNNTSTDLEEECRTTWEEALLNLHNFALALDLEY